MSNCEEQFLGPFDFSPAQPNTIQVDRGRVCSPPSRGWLTFLLGLVLLSVAQTAQAQLPTTIGWTALPASTSLQGSGACPPNNFGGDPFLFTEYCQNVVRAWNGAIADTTANRLIIWGGGHNNYYGNEIYALNLTTNPITLVRLKDPTVPTNYENASNCIDGIPPGSPNFAPNSRESYGGLAFVPTAYRMYIEGGSVACLLGDQSENTWTISLSSLSNSTSWVHENPTIAGPVPGSDGGFTYGNIAAYDPNSGLVFLSDSAAIYTYNYQTNTYNEISPSPQGFVTSIYLSGAIDPTGKLFVMVGGACSNGSCGPGDGVFAADISNPESTTQQNWTKNTLANPTCAEFLYGGVNPISNSNPGITFDSVANDFVAWPNQGNSVYILTPDEANQRLTCTKQTFANGPPNSAHHSGEPNTTYGTFGRFRYFPALDAFVLVNDWNIPAYILRLRGSTSSDFSLSVTPPVNSVTAGGTTTYTASVGAIGSFGGIVTLGVSGLPSGSTASFSSQSINTSGNSTLSVRTGSNTPAGSYTLTVSGASGSLSHTATATLTVTAAPVPTFTLAVNPPSSSVSQGGKGTYTVTVSAQNGFTGSVGLSVSGLPSGASASFSPTSISGSGSSKLTVTTAASTPAGSYTLGISGTSGSITQRASVELTVTGGSSSTGSVISVNFAGSGVAMGASEVAGVVPESNWNQASGASSSAPLALVDHTGASTGATITWKADNVWKLPITDQVGNLRMMRGYLDNEAGDTTTITVSGLPADANGYNIYVYADGDNGSDARGSLYQISGAGIVTTTTGLADLANTDFDGTFVEANNSVGNYVMFTVSTTGFTLSAIPTTAQTSVERAPVNGIQIVPR